MGTFLEQLAEVTRAEAGALVAGFDGQALVEAVRATDDPALAGLMAREDLRAVLVEGLLARLDEYAVPERLALVAGTVRFDLTDAGRVVERHALVLEGGAIKLLTDQPETEPADVVLRLAASLLPRLCSGEVNAGLEYLSGRLDITGDADLAVALGGVFRVPGTDDVAVDPTALDPVDVATVLATTPPEHLRNVMASGFRPIVLGEVLRRLPEFVNARKARGADLRIGLRLLGHPSGEMDRYLIRVHESVATVITGGAEESRDATVTCQAHDFIRLATGHLSAVTGVLRGQLKIRGDRAKALQLSTVIDFPKAR